MTVSTAVPPSDAPAVQFDAGSACAPWNQPEPETATESDLRQSVGERIVLGVFIALPFVAMVAAVPVAAIYGWISWVDVGLAWSCTRSPGTASPSASTATSPTGRSGPTGRCVSPGVAGTLAIEGRPHGWPTTAGTTRSPTGKATRTRPGATAPGRGLAKGLLVRAHRLAVRPELTNQERSPPTCWPTKDISRVDRLFPALVAVSLLVPPLIGGLVTWSWTGALTAFFWAALVRIGPAAPRHLVDQLDLPRLRRAPLRHPGPRRATSGRWRSCRSARAGTTCTTPTRPAPATAYCAVRSTRARLIWMFEKLGWAYDVRWPRPERLTAKRARE